MRISHNLTAMNTYRQYNTNTVNTNKSMEKLSSGARINRAADDAAGLSISEKMRSQIRGLTQATRNAQDGVSFIQTAEGALNEVSDMLVRLKELTTQVNNGTYSLNDQKNIGAEMKSLGKAITDIYVNTKFNSKQVFGTQTFVGASGDDADSLKSVAAASAGVAATIWYGENGGQKVEIKQATTASLNALTEKTKIAHSVVSDVSQATLITDGDVEGAITEVNKTRADYGAMQNQLEHASNNMAATKENLQSAESRVRDVDMADEMMTYTKNNILLQAAQAMLAQANSQPQGILQLLQ
ncbi:MAG: flagellin [Christensenellaceae bacterium]|nr:flagellin [Christensenellaceae bacterium]